MQTVYTKKNINLNYLNNYVRVSINDNELYLYNTIYNKKVFLKSSNSNLKELLKHLYQGIEYEKLIIILQNITDKPNDLYEYLLQNFIIE